jgi:hypothetical protein
MTDEKTQPPFTLHDMGTVLAIIDNQPLQATLANLQAVEQLRALRGRFLAFCTIHLTPPAEVAATGPVRKGKNGAAKAPDPLT